MEAPHLQALHRKYFGQGLRVVGVAPLTGPVDELRGFVQKHRISYPTLVDPREKLLRQYHGTVYPLTVLIDRNGVVRGTNRGFKPGDEVRLEREILRLLL